MSLKTTHTLIDSINETVILKCTGLGMGQEVLSIDMTSIGTSGLMPVILRLRDRENELKSEYVISQFDQYHNHKSRIVLPHNDWSLSVQTSANSEHKVSVSTNSYSFFNGGDLIYLVSGHFNCSTSDWDFIPVSSFTYDPSGMTFNQWMSGIPYASTTSGYVNMGEYSLTKTYSDPTSGLLDPLSNKLVYCNLHEMGLWKIDLHLDCATKTWQQTACTYTTNGLPDGASRNSFTITESVKTDEYNRYCNAVGYFDGDQQYISQDNPPTCPTYTMPTTADLYCMVCSDYAELQYWAMYGHEVYNDTPHWFWMGSTVLDTNAQTATSGEWTYYSYEVNCEAYYRKSVYWPIGLTDEEKTAIITANQPELPTRICPALFDCSTLNNSQTALVVT